MKCENCVYLKENEDDITKAPFYCEAIDHEMGSGYAMACHSENCKKFKSK